ncbi:hypothetical protein KC953_02225 [Candidatus Saccharibacteria bacterium]|nr:hypothetical protein [Candidatus Saccharibacteria bacterium]
MSFDNLDHFKKWELDMKDVQLPELPKDPLDTIVENSTDPIDCAGAINKYLLTNSDEAQSVLIRRGLTKLSYKHYGEYLSKNIAVLADTAFGIPEPDEKLRKRNILEASHFHGSIFAMGKLATFLGIQLINNDTGDRQTLLSLRISEPHILSDDGDIKKDIELPDYLVFPLSSVQTYKFQ